ncbi:hypothetical protein [Alkalihalobacillus deserti]|uniref:hypothetical protein n=1 Tax=Alkalihalobacillus deserti TaxID=2879466 RepID=UPI001D14AD25|nr:hypothetical protein [Alkalihalobacillus deserti]
MRKIIMFSIIIIAVILVGIFSFIKFNPPLVSGIVGATNDYNAVVVEIGNKGFAEVKVDNVLVNGNEEPLNLKMQVSNPLKGFIITDTFDEEAKEYGIHDIENVTIKPNTSPSAQLEKVNNGTATTDDKSYGISVIHNKEIETVNIKYSFLGISFDKTVTVK